MQNTSISARILIAVVLVHLVAAFLGWGLLISIELDLFHGLFSELVFGSILCFLHLRILKRLRIRSVAFVALNALGATFTLFYCFYHGLADLWMASYEPVPGGFLGWVEFCSTRKEILGVEKTILGLVLLYLLIAFLQVGFFWEERAKPFCERCDQWKSLLEIPLRPGFLQEFCRLIRSGDLKMLAHCIDFHGIPRLGHARFSYCKDCSKDATSGPVILDVIEENVTLQRLIRPKNRHDLLKNHVLDEAGEAVFKSIREISFPLDPVEALPSECIHRKGEKALFFHPGFVAFPVDCICCGSSDSEPMELVIKNLSVASFLFFFWMLTWPLVTFSVCSSCRSSYRMKAVCLRLPVILFIASLVGLLWSGEHQVVVLAGFLSLAIFSPVLAGFGERCLMKWSFGCEVRGNIFGDEAVLHHPNSEYLDKVEKATKEALQNRLLEIMMWKGQKLEAPKLS